MKALFFTALVLYGAAVILQFTGTAFKKSEWGELYKEFTKPTETKPFKFFA